jgi:very-short-patch-repair endonuclease
VDNWVRVSPAVDNSSGPVCVVGRARNSAVMPSSVNIHDVFRGSAARKHGYVTAAQLRGPRFRRLFQDVYAPAHLPVTHELRCRGAALIVPAEAVVTGRSAATILGVTLAKPYDPVEIVVPEQHRFGPVAGIRVRRTAVSFKESRPWNGIRIAKPGRTALDLALRLSPRNYSWVRRLRIAVPDLDAFIRSGLVTVRQLRRSWRGLRNRGIRLARAALSMVDPRAESLPESELRVVLQTGGFRVVPQHSVVKNGREVARLDLALKNTKTAIEYDGRWHRKRRHVRRDKARRKRLMAEGWTFVVITAEKLQGDYRKILDEVRQAQSRAARSTSAQSRRSLVFSARSASWSSGG